MNSVIIHTLRKRSKLMLTRSDTQIEGQGHNEGQGQNEGHSSKMKSSDKQIVAMLLLVRVSNFNDSRLRYIILL